MKGPDSQCYEVYTRIKNETTLKLLAYLITVGGGHNS